MSAPRPGLILTVDDEPANRYAVSRVLMQAGYDVIEATTAGDALRLCLERKPDLIVLDVKLPDMSGYEVCRRLKGNPDTATILVLQVSATFVHSQDTVRSLDAGADSYLTQPVEPPVLVATVGALLRLRRAEEALRDSEARYRVLFERNPLPAWVVDMDASTIVAVNDAAVERYAYSREAFLAMRIGDLHAPADVPAVLTQLDGVPGQIGVWRHRTRDGTDMDVELTATPIRFGKHRACIVIAIDVTERRRLERARAELLGRERAARAQAEEANLAKDDFLATLSHELRTPLNAMLGWVRVLQSGKSDEGTTARGLDAIERNCRIQAQLIEDLLDVSRIIAGKLTLERNVLDLADVTQAAVEGLRVSAHAKGLDVVVRAERAPVHVEGDFARLQQVAANLISNAIKFTGEGGRITVNVEARGAHAALVVTDTGQGIRPEFLPHVFEKFRQADSSTARAHTGLGLGLAIVRHLVELHGGRVDAASRGEGQGSTFTVTLPLATAARPAEFPAAISREGQVSLDGVHVLVVDDDVDSLALASVALGHCGARVTAARSGSEALEAVKADAPDVLVSDLGMPGMDGIQLIRELREATGTVMPAVAVTAYAHSADVARTLAAGYRMHLSKPLDPMRLAEAVASLAGRT
ncbi:MAG TPA: response regulator [Methylomirabilota bacterium]|nr:response regulator [Methylomirabilota bacterium]